MEGSVYVLTNPAMPNMVKIGKTTRDVELRLADLYSTGVPLPFECEYALRTLSSIRWPISLWIISKFVPKALNRHSTALGFQARSNFD